MLHVWCYYYKGARGRKKFFDSGVAYHEKDAIHALEVAKMWTSDDDDDGDRERLTGTRWGYVCVYITKDSDAETKDNGDGTATTFFNRKNVIYHEDTKTGEFFQNEKVLLDLGALTILHV